MNNQVWLIRHKATGEILFMYKTHQGKHRKAVFSSERYALDAINNYIIYRHFREDGDPNDYEPFCIGKRYRGSE